MRIEIADHAPNCAVEEFGVVQWLDVVALDALEHFREQARLLPVELFLLWGRLLADQSATHRQAETEHTADDDNQNRTNFQ